MPNEIPKNQISLDKMLSKRVRLPVLFEEGAEPPDTAAYRPIHEIRKSGFQFELRSLLHAIGCKTANLSMKDDDEAIRSAHLYTHALDMRRTDIGLRKATPRDSDLLKNRSHEIGVGVTCLLAWQAWRFPWDEMEPIPAPGLRFDYRAKNGRLQAIFEARGASSPSTHKKQIAGGLKKKKAHHQRREYPDIQLIIATHLAPYGVGSHITIADPGFDIPEWTFESIGELLFPLRHWTRILNFIGDTNSATTFYDISRQMLNPHHRGRRQRTHRRWPRHLDSIVAGEREFVGTWHQSDELTNSGLPGSVFHGLESTVYNTLISSNPWAKIETPEWKDIHVARAEYGGLISVFPDGSALAFRYDRS